MIDVIRFFIREPALAGVVFLCVALVLSLIWSDWMEKRRMRALLRAREAAREAARRGDLAETFPAASRPAAKQPFRFFRWEFAVLSIIVIAFVYPSASENTPVTARESEARTSPVVQPEPTVQPTVTASAKSTGTQSTSSGGGSLNPDALFQFDTTSDLGDPQRSVLAPAPGSSEFSLPEHRGRSRFSRQ